MATATNEYLPAVVETITPETAIKWLEDNPDNRPVTDALVARIAGEISAGRWVVNRETIKFDKEGHLLDGQHRLWAIVRAKESVQSYVARGVDREFFATLDTIRRARTPGDILALMGCPKYRNYTGAALQWLVRWQRNVIDDYKAPKNRVENHDVQDAFKHHPEIVRAVTRAMTVNTVANPSVVGFFYYILASRDADMAERMISALDEPAGLVGDDPFFALRRYFTAGTRRRLIDPVVSIACMIKAANLVKRGGATRLLTWHGQGQSRERFPTLEV